jgi:hypothetical protein
LPGYTVRYTAHANEDLTQRPVIKVDYPSPDYPSWVNVQFVAMLKVIIDHGGQQVVGFAHRVHIAYKMEVNIF